MHFNIFSKLGVTVKDTGFSIDELIVRMQDLFQQKAFPELLKEILMLFDEVLRILVMKKSQLPVQCECGCTDYVLDGTRSRTIRTPIGTVVLPAIMRVKCASCGRTRVPLLDICGIEAYQSKTRGLEKIALEKCVETSYRRVEKDFASSNAVRIDHSTFHRWMLRTDADDISVPPDVITSVPGAAKPRPVQLFADGTKCKCVGDDGPKHHGPAKTGDVKVLLGIRDDGAVFPVGTWSGHETWKEIGDELERRKIKFPEGSVLICDGEQEISEELAKIVNGYHQRCQWHTQRDLYHTMWQDGGNEEKCRPFRDRLKKVMAIELPKESFEKVSDKDKQELQKKTDAAEKDMETLIKDVRSGGYVKAANYLENAKKSIFAYVRRWLLLGIACPKASSFIERTMRELGRRIKKLAYNWKEEGLNKVTNILLKIFASNEEWEKFWREKMDLNQKVLLNFNLEKHLCG